MKRIYLFVFCSILLGGTLKAQVKKDWFIIGGTLSNIGLDLQKGNTQFQFDLTPKVAWFIKDNFALGFQALIGLNTGNGYTQVSYGIGPFARYYFPQKDLAITARTRFFMEASAGINGQNTKTSGLPSANTNGLGIGIGPGLAYFINPNIAFEALIKYNLSAGFGNAPTDHAINVGIGFQIHLPKSKLKSLQNNP